MTKRKIINAPVVIIALVAALLIVFLKISLTSTPMLQGDYPYYPDVQSITDSADVIIVGEVVTSGDVQDLMVDRTPGKEDKEPIKYTLSTVEVTEVISGDVQVGDILTVKQIGDYKNLPEATLKETDGYLKAGQTELMFLASYENSPYSAVNPAQGTIEVLDGGELYSASKYSLWGYNDTSTRSAGSVDTLADAIAEIKDCL